MSSCDEREENHGYHVSRRVSGVSGGAGCAAHTGDRPAPHATPLFNLVIAAKAPLPHLLTFARERGWRHLKLVSCHANTYSGDYGGQTADGAPMPMLNVFHRDGVTIRHFWGAELMYAPTEPGQDPRQVGTLEPIWNMLDLTPEGARRSGTSSSAIGDSSSVRSRVAPRRNMGATTECEILCACAYFR